MSILAAKAVRETGSEVAVFFLSVKIYCVITTALWSRGGSAVVSIHPFAARMGSVRGSCSRHGHLGGMMRSLGENLQETVEFCTRGQKGMAVGRAGSYQVAPQGKKGQRYYVGWLEAVIGGKVWREDVCTRCLYNIRRELSASIRCLRGIHWWASQVDTRPPLSQP